MMKKRNLLLTAIIALAISSCNDKKKEDVNLENPTYAKKSVAQTQTDLENTGIKMVDEMKSFNKEPGVNATVNLLDLANSSNKSSSTNKLSVFRSLSVINAVSMNKATVNEVMTVLQEKNISIISEYNDVAGTYTYNFTTKDWDIVKNKQGTIKYLFPASKTSLSAKKLDGTIEVFRPEVKTGSFDIDGQIITELPTSLKYILSVDGKEVVSYNFSASYNDKGLPINVNSTLKLGSFEFNVSYGYKTSDVFVNYSFKHGSTTILDLGAASNGNFDKTNIENAKHTKTVTDQYGTYQETESDPEKVIFDANAHFQFMDIKTVGKIDFKNFYTEAKKINNDSITAQVALINKYIDLVVVYASNNQAIAKAQAYKKKDRQIIDWVWNNDKYTSEPVYGDVDVVDFRMIMADNKPVDFNTYWNDGFDKLVASFNTFITDLNNTYKFQSIDPIPTVKKD